MKATAIFHCKKLPLVGTTLTSVTVSTVLSAALACGAFSANAQTVFRIVGPDGKVTFSDKRPPSANEGKLVGTGVGAKADATGSALPFELRQVVGKYPVVLYTSGSCAPCDKGRALLEGRGIPFTERTISTKEDADALQRLSGGNNLPFLTIGSQKIKGMSDMEWQQYLDAAGYPKASMLSAGYKNPPPSPLVTVQQAAAEPKPEAKPAVPENPTTPPPPAFNPANPAGIQF